MLNRKLLIIPCVLLSLLVQAQNVLVAVKKDSKWGYVDLSNTYVIPAKYDDANAFYKGRAVVTEKVGEFTIIDEKGSAVSPPMKGQARGEIVSNRIVCSNEKGKWGAINRDGKMSVPFEYDGLSGFQNGLALAGVKKTGADLLQVIVIDTLGRSIVNFDNMYFPVTLLNQDKKIRDGYVSVLVDGAYSTSLTPSTYKVGDKQLFFGLLDIKNKRLINIKLPSLATEVREGRLNLVFDGIAYSWGLPLSAEPVPSEAKFNLLSPALFSFSSGIAATSKGDKWAYVDKDGSLLNETNLPVADYKSDAPAYAGGFIIFRKKSGEGIYTDLKGVQRIPIDFEELQPFQSGAAVVKVKGKYGLIQKDGTWAIEAIYDDVRF